MEPFDFARPAALPASQVEALQETLTSPTMRAGMLLGARLRIPVSLRLAEVAPASAALVGADRTLLSSQVGNEVVVVSGLSTFVCELADIVMGGAGQVADRGPSPLEQRLVATHIGPVLADIATAAVAEMETGTPFVPVLDDPRPSMDGGVAVNIEVTSGDLSGLVSLVLPAALLGNELAAPTIDLEGTTTNPLMLDALCDVPINLAVRFSPVVLAAADLDHLDVGDVIRLEHPEDQPLTALVDDRPLFLARPGRHGRHLAVQVEHVFDEVAP